MEKIKALIARWVKKRYLNIAVFNVFLMFLVLLHSAKYFDPFWVISINMVVLMGLVASVFLLGANSAVMFVASVAFWLFASMMRLLRVNVWADRVGIYVFEALLVGVLLLIFENIKIIKFWKRKK